MTSKAEVTRELEKFNINMSGPIFDKRNDKVFRQFWIRVRKDKTPKKKTHRYEADVSVELADSDARYIEAGNAALRELAPQLKPTPRKAPKTRTIDDVSSPSPSPPAKRKLLPRENILIETEAWILKHCKEPRIAARVKTFAMAEYDLTKQSELLFSFAADAI